MTYAQITLEERYVLAVLLRQGQSQAAIARSHRFRLADHYANGQRWRSRRNTQFTAADWATVESLLREGWSPEQIVGRYARWVARIG